MPKSANQKRKLLVLYRFLLARTDDDHPVTVQEMQDELTRWDISAERKSIYNDMEELRQLGVTSRAGRGNTLAGSSASGSFELAELKLLVDAVQSSRFLTLRKSDSLIRKLEGLASVYQAQKLQRQVYVDRRVKTMNESIFYNVDKLHTAIAAGRRWPSAILSTMRKRKRSTAGKEGGTTSPPAG